MTGVDRIDRLVETGSTNDVALALPDKGAVPVHLIVAERQTAGRGRRENRWFAGEGALTFSALVHLPSLSISAVQRPYIPLATGLALCRAIQAHVQAPCSVKWPNDVYIGDRKVSGILVETCADAADCLVIGIGVNVRNVLHAEIADMATRVIDHGPEPDDPLGDIMRELFVSLEQLRTSHTVLVTQLNTLSYLTGKQVQVDACCGVCRGIAPSGAIVISTSSGTREIMAGTVSVL
jgi:BirA family biotin operon repressor/biotin-[acetyl-CoA-carboxylase] ligase